MYILAEKKPIVNRFFAICISMKEKLEKIKGLLELSVEDSTKRDLLVGQAIGLIDSLLDSAQDPAKLDIPDMIWKHVEKPTNETMMDAVKRHKEVHEELSKDSVSQKNTQFKKL